MATKTETPEQIAQWLAEEWGRSFAGVIESMADINDYFEDPVIRHLAKASSGLKAVRPGFVNQPAVGVFVGFAEIVNFDHALSASTYAADNVIGIFRESNDAKRLQFFR